MKYIISAWPGAGGTTLSMLLAYYNDFTLIEGSSMFRYIARDLKIGDTGAGMIDADKLLQEEFAPLYDKYMTSYLTKDNENAVIDTDMISFDSKNYDFITGIYLHSSFEARKERLITDSRPEDIEFLEERLKNLSQAYRKLYYVDIESISDLKNRYDFVLDNSNITIAEELRAVSKKIDEETSTKLERLFWSKGKDWFIEELKNKNLLRWGKNLLKDLNSKFPNEVAQLPENISRLIKNC